MMQIVYFSSKTQFLEEVQLREGEKVFIAPGPAKADGLRSILKESSSIDVVTIAKFTSDLIKHLWDENDRPAVKRKAELLLIFGILKKKYLPELGYEQFIQAYNLFSDLRSFTLNLEALSSVIEEQSPEIKKAVELFWRLLEITGYLDEHGAYYQISERLRSADEKEYLKKTFIFWGFQHLNGQQVDLIKSISIRYNVLIPFPLTLREKLKKSDWPTWLKDSRVIEKELEEIPRKPQGKCLKINSREISTNLTKLMKSGDQIILGVSKLSPLHLDIVPSKEVFYKIPHQLIRPDLMELAIELKTASKEDHSLAGLEKFLEQKFKKTVNCISRKVNFKKLKAIELYQQVVREIRELTDEEIIIDHFFLKLISEVASLNQPRNFYVPVSSQKFSMDFKDMSSLEDIKRDRRVILCIDDRFEEILSLGQNYTETIQKTLAGLGPLKRNELELLFKQWEFNDLFSQGEVIVLMSESILKHSLIWKKLFLEIDLIGIEQFKESKQRLLTDQLLGKKLLKFSGSYSASKIQAYLDCPRKFYYQYVEKVFPQVILKNDLNSLISGSVSHKIIELYFKQKLNQDDLPLLVKKVLKDTLLENGISLDQEKMLRHEIVFKHRSSNGIEFLHRMNHLLQGKVDWLLEEDFVLDNEFKLKGKIDCIGITDKVILLLDFKSTRFAASSNKEVEQFESIQLWAYAMGVAKRIKDFEKKSIIMGYISLDRPSDSNLLFNDIEVFETFKSAGHCRQYFFKDPFAEIFQSSVKKIKETVEAIEVEEYFLPRPRKYDICQFCDINKICVKSELSIE